MRTFFKLSSTLVTLIWTDRSGIFGGHIRKIGNSLLSFKCLIILWNNIKVSRDALRIVLRHANCSSAEPRLIRYEVLIYIWAYHRHFPHHLTPAARRGRSGGGEGESPWAALVTSLLTIFTSVIVGSHIKWKKGLLWNTSRCWSVATLCSEVEQMCLLLNYGKEEKNR